MSFLSYDQNDAMIVRRGDRDWFLIKRVKSLRQSASVWCLVSVLAKTVSASPVSHMQPLNRQDLHRTAWPMNEWRGSIRTLPQIIQERVTSEMALAVVSLQRPQVQKTVFRSAGKKGCFEESRLVLDQFSHLSILRRPRPLRRTWLGRLLQTRMAVPPPRPPSLIQISTGFIRPLFRLPGPNRLGERCNQSIGLLGLAICGPRAGAWGWRGPTIDTHSTLRHI